VEEESLNQQAWYSIGTFQERVLSGANSALKALKRGKERGENRDAGSSKGPRTSARSPLGDTRADAIPNARIHPNGEEPCEPQK